MPTQTLKEPQQGTDKPRCKDCDSDCWDVPNKLVCWMGVTKTINSITYVTDIAEGYCPWLMEGIPFPPKP